MPPMISSPIRCAAALLLLLSLPAAVQARGRYDIDYRVRFEPESKSAVVTIATRPGSGRLISLDLRMGPKRYTDLAGDGAVERRGRRVLWTPPAAGGELRYRYRIDHRRPGDGYDARITDNWAIVRGDDLVPSAIARTTRRADSRARLYFDLPAEWSVDTPWMPSKDGASLVVVNPERRLDRPIGWVVAGKLGTRRERLDGTLLSVSAPRGESFRRNEILAMVHVAYPELTAAFGDLPRKLLILGADDPMWRGGLSGPRSLYFHADRPLISENGTSTLFHELVHTITRIQGNNEDWIAEGIAEFYSLALPYRSGLLSENRYRRALDWMRRRGRLVRSLRAVPSNGPVTARAVTLFAALDAELRERSGGERSLDDLVRRLMEIRRPTLEELRAETEALLGAPSKSLQSRVLE